MKKYLLLLAYSYISICKAQLPIVVSGTVERISDFPSQFVSPRNIDVWLPDGYSPSKKYTVLYMQDGQMLFDASTTWNKSAWEIDDVASKLIKANQVKDFIVVGIWNGGSNRHSEYFPEKAYQTINKTQKDSISAKLKKMGRTKETFSPNSDEYLKFLVNELKPMIDEKYAVYKDKRHTFIAGSSMGALISMYAICEYPNVFGGAICMSTHWPGIFEMEGNPIPDAFLKYLTINLPNPKNHKFYFDYGDQTLDALYPTLQKRVDEVMKDAGYSRKNWMTKFFPGDDHSEKSWSKRMDIPILFVLKK